MKNRRTFIKQLSAAGIISSMPSALIVQQDLTQPIRLLVRADDMGNSWGRTFGIIKAHKEGIVTSTSIMVPSQFFSESVKLCNENPTLAVGIHFTLVATRTRSVLSPEIVPSILTKEGFFYETLDELERANPKTEEIEKEMRAQIGKARASGLNFVYLDWHRGGGEGTRVAKLREEITKKLCREQKLIFGQDNDGIMYGYMRTPFVPENWPTSTLPDRQVVHYPAPELSADDRQVFFNRLINLKPGNWTGVVHPGWGEPERKSVTELLCSPQTKEIIKQKNIQLVSYNDLWKEEYGKNKS